MSDGLVDFSYDKKKCINCLKEFSNTQWYIYRQLGKVYQTNHVNHVHYEELVWAHKCKEIQ
jgi:hypothetical protein